MPRYTDEQVLAEARTLFGSMDFSDENTLGKLTYAYAEDNYPWFSSACTRFGNRYYDWYGALESLLLAAGGKGDDEARAIVERVRCAGKKKIGMKTKYTAGQIREEFRKLIEGMDLESNLGKFTLAYAQENYPWFSSACRTFAKSNDWYGVAEKLLSESIGDAKAGELIVKIREVGKQHFIGSSPANKPRFGPSEVREEFRKLTEGMDFSDENTLGKLTYAYAEDNYPWFSSACTLFGKKYHDWYGALESLLVGAVGLDSRESLAILERIRKAGNSARRAANKSRMKYSPEEVRSEFKRAVGHEDFSDDGSLFILLRSFALENYDWFSSAATHFGSNGGDWYGAVKALLSEEQGLESAKAIVARVKKASIKERVDNNPRNMPSYSAGQVREEFRKITEGMDFSDDSALGSLTLTFAVGNYAWFSSAVKHFGEKNSDWYGAAENLLAESLGADSARCIITKIRAIGKRNTFDSSPANKPKFGPSEVREEFRKITKGMDFSDENALGLLTYSSGKINYPWFSSACTLFGKKPGDWYGALESLLAEDIGADKANVVVEMAKRTRKRQKGRGGSIDVILVPSQRLTGGKSVDFSPFVEILASAEMQVLRNGSVQNGNAQKVVLSVQGTGTQTGAQRLRFGLGSQSWETIAKEYMERFSTLAPFIIHHLAVEKLLQHAKKRQLLWPESILSQASGVSELHLAFQGLKKKVEASGFAMPRITDLDITSGMLESGANPVKVRADMREMPFGPGAFAMVENSSIYQCRNPGTIKEALLEASRVTRQGGALILSSANRPFSIKFHSALEGIGYEPLCAPDDALVLSEGFLSRVNDALGESFASRLAERVNGWHILVAVKRHDAKDVDAELFRLGRIQRARDPQLLEIGRVSRAAFNSSSLEDFDAGISAILGLLKEMETANPREVWRLYDRISRLEKGKLSELGAESGYGEKRGDVEKNGREFLERLRRKAPSNDNQASTKRKLPA